MKLLILLLLSLNAYASHRIEIIPNNPNEARLHVEVVDHDLINERIVKFISDSKVYTGIWNGLEADSIAHRVSDIEETTEYFHPSNFTINTVDRTIEEAAIETKAARKTELRNKAKIEPLTVLEMNEYLFN
jgi:hypothetical protein